MGTVHEVIVYCQKQIKKEPPPDRLLHYLRKLSRLRITIDDLSDTGIGKTVNQLSRLEGEVGRFAGKIVEAWKAMVENQAQEQAQQEEEDEEEEEEEEEDDVEDDEEEDEEPEIEAKPGIHIHEKSGAKSPDSDDAELEIDTSRRFDSSPENRRDSEEESEEAVHRNPVNHDHNAGHYGDLSIGESSAADMDVNSDDERPGMKFESGSSSASSDSEDENLNIRHRRSSPEHIKIKSENSGMVQYPKVQNGNLKPDVINSLEIPKERVKRSEESENNRHHHQKDHHHHKESSRREKDEKTRHRQDESPIKSSIKTEYNHNASSRESRGKYKSSDKSSDVRNHHSESREKKHSSGSSNSKDPSRQEKQKERSSSSRSKSKEKDRDRERDRDRNRDRHEHKKSHESRKPREEELKSKSRDKNREKDREQKEGKEREIEDRSSSSKHSSNKSDSSKEKHHREKREKEEKEIPKLIIPSATKIKIESSRDSDGSSPRPGSSSSHKRKKERDPSPEPERKEKSHKKQKIISQLEQNEIDSTCGLNFADVLGCLDKAPVLKPSKKVVTPTKIAPSSSSSASKTSSRSNGDSGCKSSTSNGVPKKTESIIPPPKPLLQQKASKYESYAPPVPIFQPPKPVTKYKPIDILPRDDDYANRTNYENSLFKLSSEPIENEYEALSSMMKSRKDRTKVYSGNKTGFVGQLPSLFQSCIRVIQENLDCLGYTGGVPYDILKPAIERATVKQLAEIEYYNPYLLENTDELWEFHCKREFRGDKPDELETWRDLYYRRKEEQQEKLKNLASKVKKSTELAQPIRKAKLAYVEPSIRGTRFNKTKAATIKNGMKTLKHREEQGIKAGGASYSANNGSKNIVTEEAAITISSESRAGSAPAPSRERECSSSSSSSNAFKKPKKAPLMQKTMKLIKSLHRR